MFGTGSSVGGLRFRLVPVHVPLNQWQAVIHLIHRQQGHLGHNENNVKWMKTATVYSCSSLNIKKFGLVSNLQIAINKPVGLEVIIILTKRIYELLSHLKMPTIQLRVVQISHINCTCTRQMI